MRLERTLSEIPIIKEIDALKSQVDLLRPFDRETENRILQKFRLDWNYHSNAIEGNPYTYGETVAFIMHGITAKGKKLKDHLDIKGHDETVQYILDLVKADRVFAENDIRELHKMILKEPYDVDAVSPSGQFVKKRIKLGEYKNTPNHVKTATGEMHYYATPEETPAKMTDLMNWLNLVLQEEAIHPLIVASLFHHKFVAIHPFDDGNGRLGRILMNFILMKKGFSPIVVRQNDRENYYAVLSQADVGESLPLVEYLGVELEKSLDIQLRGAKGEDITELGDVDKELILLKKRFGDEDKLKIKRDNQVIQNVLNQSIFPLIQKLDQRINKVEELFLEKKRVITLIDDDGGHHLPTDTEYSINLENLKLSSELRSLQFEHNLLGFKKDENPFDIHTSLRVNFWLYKFEIIHDKNIKLEKFYSEQVDNNEANELVKAIIKKEVIEKIKQYTNK
ncbi:MAG: Fic family protein [Bacteroidota bacterium]